MRWIVPIVLAMASPAFAQDSQPTSEPASQAASTPATLPASEPASIAATEPAAMEPAATEESVGLAAEVLGGTARFGGSVMSRLALDTRFDPTGEDVFEFRNRAILSLDYRWASRFRVFIQGRFDWFVVGGEPRRQAFFFFNAANPRWDYVLDLREAFVDVYTRYVDIRLGNQVFTWGQNEGVSPIDVLNPIDARDVLAQTDLFKVPVPAVQATVALGDKGSLRAVWIPFFIPNKANLYGQDFALLTPGSDFYNSVGDISRVIDPSLDPRINQALVGTKLPPPSPASSTVGLRLQYQLGPVDLALSGVFGWNRIPRVKIDPDLRAALQANLLGDPSAVINDPALRDTVLRLQQKTQLGIALVDATYERTGTVGFDIGASVSDFTFKGDFGWSPNVTVYGDDFLPLTKHTLRSAAGVEYRYGDILQAAISWHSTAVLNMEAGERLMFLEPHFQPAGKRRHAFYWGFIGLLRLSLFDDRLKLTATAVYDPMLAQVALLGQAGWHFTESHSLTLMGMWLDGPWGTPFGHFTKSDQIALEYRYAF
ncbi:MAG: hypothetical protein IT381_18945 [Deltaproteobacteria bacterium]|nr:hypothetical protein [Deltaproteobacteria bacterium]